MTRQSDHLPLVYSCSGFSSVAQITNTLALRLNREGEAQMSCIAGVGGDVPNLVRQATSGQPILALDGCPLGCALGCLKRNGVEPDRYVQLQKYGIKKKHLSPKAAEQETERLYPMMVELARGLRLDRDQPQGQPRLGQGAR